VLKALLSDSYRKNGRFRFADILYGLAFLRTHRVLVTLRLCQSVQENHGVISALLPLFKVLHLVASQMAGMDLPWRTRIGLGLAITHGWGFSSVRLNCEQTQLVI
jgi:serine O-acetyltransferase